SKITKNLSQNEVHSDPDLILYNPSVLIDKEPEFFADLTYAVFFFMSFTGSESSSVSFSPLIIFNNFFTATLDI
ncbi:hypothetical protein OGS_03075, partial [Enterococcus faecium EnGen0002]